MKLTLFFLLSVFGLETLYAQDFVNGYYVTMAQDTVPCSIKIGGKKISTNYFALVVKGDGEEAQVFKAKDRQIAAYGFGIPGQRFDFRYIEIEKTNDGGFYRQIDYGPRFQLYLHMVSTNVNGVVTTLPQYAVFDTNGSNFILTTHLLGNWKKNLRKLLHDQPAALLALEEINRNQIPEFIESLNRGKNTIN
ncbi:hypothetical protein SAMN04488519_11146 [Algoriphagus ornithinivorans]|uniref:Uncharacterized protein n=1 Tax=Algoriphagus ornithinivorans TaxID=226506 RepID=A0A1I5J4L8_9BACT|nr:hypothetical protein [Algoriphagus ornithinivorans]SFO67336.1 hypothetical protein SAMN04488519_11146 [Algoriphagus ornithinivorans]